MSLESTHEGCAEASGTKIVKCGVLFPAKRQKVCCVKDSCRIFQKLAKRRSNNFRVWGLNAPLQLSLVIFLQAFKIILYFLVMSNIVMVKRCWCIVMDKWSSHRVVTAGGFSRICTKPQRKRCTWITHGNKHFSSIFKTPQCLQNSIMHNLYDRFAIIMTARGFKQYWSEPMWRVPRDSINGAFYHRFLNHASQQRAWQHYCPYQQVKHFFGDTWQLISSPL